MAIGADQGQVSQLRGGRLGRGQRQDVMGFNEARAQVTIRVGEVEPAQLAHQAAMRS